MKTFLDTEDPDIQVELIPLLDVVFCLLAVFILGTVGLSRPEGINLNLPVAQSGTPQFSSKFSVQVGILGELLANDQPVNQTQLSQLVERYLQLNPQGVVILKADGGATYDQVITVLDLLRSVGGERVALETTKGNPVTPPEPGLDQVPGQAPDDLLPVPSVDDPNSEALPATPNQPGIPNQPVPNQPIAPNQQPVSPLPGQSPGQPIPGLPGLSPSPPANPATP